jgi:hypothetical protein
MEVTPFEAWHGRNPDVSFLDTFRCIGHIEMTKPNLSKLEDRSTPMVFLGYEAGSKAYRLYDPRVWRVVVSRDVVFDEAASWSGQNSSDREAARGAGDSPFTIEYSVYLGVEEQEEEEEASAAAANPEGGSSVLETKKATPPQSPAG